jgi:hypothetical protein
LIHSRQRERLGISLLRGGAWMPSANSDGLLLQDRQETRAARERLMARAMVCRNAFCA